MSSHCAQSMLGHRSQRPCFYQRRHWKAKARFHTQSGCSSSFNYIIASRTISSPSPLAHNFNTICFNLVGVDVGFDNPIFASLEVDYEDADQDHSGAVAAETRQSLTFYELDLGLNHVVRKYSDQLDRFANMLIAVPGGICSIVVVSSMWIRKSVSKFNSIQFYLETNSKTKILKLNFLLAMSDVSNDWSFILTDHSSKD